MTTRKFLLTTLFCCMAVIATTAGERYNFNAGWKLALGKELKGSSNQTDDSQWQKVTLPYAWNQAEAYSRNCGELSDTIMWYRKHFAVPAAWKGKKIFVEFEGARFGARVFMNGKSVGWGENGVMAFGFDLTPYVKYGAENIIAVYVDSDWKYHEHEKRIVTNNGEIVLDKNGNPKMSRAGFQWNDKNFYCNYGGVNKNVWLHVMDPVYQTLPLYTNLKTTGVYVYGTDYNIKGKSVKCNVESQVVNSTDKAQKVTLHVDVLDKDGKSIATFNGKEQTINAGDTTVISANGALADVHFWSWGYGYLYTVKTSLTVAGSSQSSGGIAGAKFQDVQSIQTGFRKTEYKNGIIYLNDRALQLKGFAQRSTNEWPDLGISIPAWMSDYSNKLVLGCNGNFYRWMHVTPSKQDVRSFDRLGLIMAMPAGDAEKDVNDLRWTLRCEVMRDAIIYNRNNPSILFYEGGNNNISDDHMAQLKAIRDKYDPKGGRASGSRNMLNTKEAEYGGEMLYINKSDKIPMFMMEYCRDEGIRRYWDKWSYPYHEEGEGPLYRGSRAVDYNHNQDGLAVENIKRWNEYWLARPGQGKRVNSGGAKIIFADSNTHARGEKSYRTSGDVDAMRIAKDSYFCHQAMWDGWVDTEKDHTYIIGHWNYEDGVKSNGVKSKVVKPVYVCSTGDEVELYLNDKSLGKGKRSNTFLFTFDNIEWQPGTLKAVAYKNGKECSSYEIKTAGKETDLKLTWIGPEGTQLSTLNSQLSTFRADGADIRIAQIEAVDAQGNRCPLAHDMITFDLKGKGDYIGGVSGVVSEEEKAMNAAAKPATEGEITAEGGHSKDTNGVGSKQLMLEAGVIRVMVRSTTEPGTMTLTASAPGLKAVSSTLTTVAAPVKDGFYVDAQGKPMEADWAKALPCCYDRGETPSAASYTDHFKTVDIKSVEVPVNQELTQYMYDSCEATDSKMYHIDSKWTNSEKGEDGKNKGGRLENGWVKVTLAKPALIKQVSLKMDNFRNMSYPLQILADGKVIWEGYTDKTLGYVYLDIKEPVKTANYEIKMVGPAEKGEAFGNMTELAAKKNVSKATGKSNTLGIIEMEWKE